MRIKSIEEMDRRKRRGRWKGSAKELSTRTKQPSTLSIKTRTRTATKSKRFLITVELFAMTIGNYLRPCSRAVYTRPPSKIKNRATDR